MIAIFARANHPHGFGYGHTSDYTQPGIGAHGYSVIGVICQTRRQAQQVIAHIRAHGLDLPDTGQGRTIYPDGQPEHPHARNVGREGVIRWYSGGPGDWDFLFTAPGNVVDWEWPQQATYGSRGDNRFCMVYTAKEVLT